MLYLAKLKKLLVRSAINLAVELKVDKMKRLSLLNGPFCSLTLAF